MALHDYIEVSKPRIVVVLVITFVASLLAGSSLMPLQILHGM